MSDEPTFKQHFLELPIFQRYMDILIRFVPAEEHVLAEIASKLLIASENGLNWDTLCQNCGVLMDDNYAQYVEIGELKTRLHYLEEDIAHLEERNAYLLREILG